MAGHADGVPDVPEDTGPDSPETCPSPELIASWLGEEADGGGPLPSEGLAVRADDTGAQVAQGAQPAARHFRDVLGRFASGVTVVTAVSDGEPVGLTCQSFSSVSLEPPLVLFVPATTSRAWPLIQRSGRFCVNFLAHDQAALANRMASRDADRFDGVAWRPSAVTGSPVLAGTLAHVDCSVHAVHEAGDHVVVLGRVLDLAADGPEEPLLFYRGAYRTTG